MSDSYKGISKLDDFSNGKYLVWKRLVLGHFSEHAKKTYSVVTALTTEDIALLSVTAAVVANACLETTAPERKLHDSVAGSDILKFLGPNMTQLHVRTESGAKIWLDLALEYAAWQSTQAPLFMLQLSSLGPAYGETVGDYCARAILLSASLEDVGRPINAAFLVDTVLQGLARERPAWSTVLLGLRGAMTGKETVSQLRGRLSETEAREVIELGPSIAIHSANAARAATTATDDRFAALESRNIALTAQLQSLTIARGGRGSIGGRTGNGGRGGAAARGLPACFRCGSTSHRVRDCPHPYVGAPSPPLRCLSAIGPSQYNMGWVLDSGCNKHMSPGGRHGCAAFHRYRKLMYPEKVHFGKRGIVADAVGVGDIVLAGPNGDMLLTDVLHVPDLAGPLFSVKSALDKGIAVHFDPPHRTGGNHTVLLLRKNRVLLTASQRSGLYFLDSPNYACAAQADEIAAEQAWQWHRRLGHIGFSTLSDMVRKDMLPGCTLTASQFLQARDQRVCEPCVVGKMRRVSHPLKSKQPMRVLASLSMDLCSLPVGADAGTRYIATHIDKATRYAIVVPLALKSDTAAAARRTICWCETQTGLRLQRVRHDRGGEYMLRSLRPFYDERGIQIEATPPYSPECNPIAERHNLVMLDMALPMLADSGDVRHGLDPLGDRYAADAMIYANDLHNCTPSKGAVDGKTPHEGFFGRAISLGIFRRFGCRVWVHNPGKPHKHRSKLAPHASPGRFLGFQHPLGCGIYRVLLDSGGERVSQTVIFDEAPFVPFPTMQPPQIAPEIAPIVLGGGDDDSDDGSEEPVAPQIGELQPAHAPEPVLEEALPDIGEFVQQQEHAPNVMPEAAAPPVAPNVAPPVAPNVPAPHAPAAGRPKRTTRNQAPAYADFPGRQAHARTAISRGVRWHSPIAVVRTFTKSSCIKQPLAPQSLISELHPLHSTTNPPPGKRTRRRRCRRTARRKPPPALIPIMSMPIRRQRTGGTVRGVLARIHRPLGRLGMAPLRSPWGSPATYKESSESSASPQASLSVCKVRSNSAVSGTGASWHHLQRDDMCCLAAASTAVQPNFREPDPLSVQEALARPDAAEWQRAIDEEIGSCLQFGVWEQSDLPDGKQALPSRMLLERKRDGRYKARLVAGGHKQQHGLDFEDTYAPVCSYRTMRMILATCAHEDLEMRQFDIRTAFLNGELEEEVYMRPPKGIPGLVDAGRVLRLRRALYGLRQAGRAWNKRLEAALKGKGFLQSDADPALWILHGGEGAVLAMFYVDDGLVAARTVAEADALVELVASMFAIRALGEPDDFLGIQITRNRSERTITIDQERKACALATAVGVIGERRAVPMSPEIYAGLRAAQPGERMSNALEYQSIIGSLLHMAQCTRPELALSVGALASYNSSPSQAHYDAAVDIVRYVGCTAERGITFGHSSVPLEIWCDANFAACQDTRRSTTGWVVVMYGGAVSWSSKKQPTTAASTMDAEYQACGSVAREGISLLKALDELSLLSNDFPIKGPLSVFCDNKAALSLCKDRKEGQRVKHIDIIHHFARDHVASGELQFLYCKSQDNVSDCLTKALARPSFELGLVGLGMLRV